VTDAPADLEGELEDLVIACLDAEDPLAELQLRAGSRPELHAAAARLIGRVSRLEKLDAADLVGAPSPRIDDPTTWPDVPGVELEALLGRGGQGVVFRGVQQYLGRAVAVKVLAPELQTPAFLQRFRREARMLAGLQHPHVVVCHDAGVTADGRCYLVMELVQGPSLWQHLSEHGPLPPATALRVTIDVASALAHAHELGLVHRDVKPENVLLQPGSGEGARAAFPFVAKLADLGLARPVQPALAGASLLTPAGAVIGTPATMAPEQLDAPDTVDQRADVYGLGCVLHHALTGRPAFSGHGITEVLLQKIALRDAGGRVELEGVPAAVCDLVSRMLAWDPRDRPATCTALGEELARLAASAAERGSQRNGVRPKAFGARPALAITLLAGSSILALAFAYSAWPRNDGSDTRRSANQHAEPDGARADVDGAAARAAGVSEDAEETATGEGSTGAAPPARAVATPPSFGAPRPLFDVASATPLAGWTTDEPQRWSVDESRRGVLVNSPRGTTAAGRSLPGGAFELRGEVEPRYRFESAAAPRVPLESLSVRVEHGDDVALELQVTPLGGTRFRAAWRHLGRRDGVWHELEELGSCEGEFPDGDPLAFSITSTATSCVARCGPRGAPGAAQAIIARDGDFTAHTRPVVLTVEASRGVAVLTEWTLSAPR
jgi:serine/threonine protein kinase